MECCSVRRLCHQAHTGYRPEVYTSYSNEHKSCAFCPNSLLPAAITATRRTIHKLLLQRRAILQVLARPAIIRQLYSDFTLELAQREAFSRSIAVKGEHRWQFQESQGHADLDLWQAIQARVQLIMVFSPCLMLRLSFSQCQRSRYVPLQCSVAQEGCSVLSWEYVQKPVYRGLRLRVGSLEAKPKGRNLHSHGNFHGKLTKLRW